MLYALPTGRTARVVSRAAAVLAATAVVASASLAASAATPPPNPPPRGATVSGPSGTLYVQMFRQNVAGMVTGEVALDGHKFHSLLPAMRRQPVTYAAPIGHYTVHARATGSQHCQAATVTIVSAHPTYVRLICD